jgi:hypothetical protein
MVDPGRGEAGREGVGVWGAGDCVAKFRAGMPMVK